MQLERAIEILTLMACSPTFGPASDEFNSLKLGIEALRRLQELRTAKFGLAHLLLPGETEE